MSTRVSVLLVGSVRGEYIVVVLLYCFCVAKGAGASHARACMHKVGGRRMHTHNPRRGTASACTRHCLHIHIPVRIRSAVSTLTVYIHAYVCVSYAPLNTCTHTSMSNVYICTYVCVLLAPPRERSRCKSAVAGAQDSEPKFAPEVRAVVGDVYINEASNGVGDGVSGLGAARRSAAIFRMLYSTLLVSVSMS